MTIPDTHDKAARETEDLLNEIVKFMQDQIVCDPGLCSDCYWLWRIQRTAIDALRSIGARKEREKRMEEKGMMQKRVVASGGRGWADLQRYEESHPGQVCVSLHGPRGGFLGNIWFSGQKLLDGLAEIGFVKEVEPPDVRAIIRRFVYGQDRGAAEELRGVSDAEFLGPMLELIREVAGSDEAEDDQPREEG